MGQEDIKLEDQDENLLKGSSVHQAAATATRCVQDVGGGGGGELEEDPV